MSIAALIVAAGRGARAADPDSPPKQYRLLTGRSVLCRAIECLAPAAVSAVQVVIHPEDRARYAAAVRACRVPLLAPVAGGATRQDSVCAGLSALKARNPEFVLIHDAARPLVPADVVERVCDRLGSARAAIAAVPVSDTLKRSAPGGLARGTVERAGLWRAQTPQGFVFHDILDAYEAANAAGRTDFTDDAAVAEWAGIDVVLVPGSERNLKLTTPEDFLMAERLLAAGPVEVRTGTGFDAHRFGPGDHVWLCGIKIAHTASLIGHSDADVGLHALTDAVLGAISDGDIGQHFPPSDPRWMGAPSRLFLEDAVRRLTERGGAITNVDVTIICEAPKISPHREEMRHAIAGMLGIGIGGVAVKATTTEGLGFTGRAEGIAAIGIATVQLRSSGAVAEAP